MTRVIHADLEVFLIGWLARELAKRPEDFCKRVAVANHEPDPGPAFPDRLVVIRSDGGPSESIVTDAIDVGVSVFAGERTLPQDAIDLARTVRALLSDVAAVEPGNPVAAVRESNGPYRVVEAQQRTRLYMTFVMVVAGVALT